ncbi:MAG: monophosphatase [Candidatus Sumerlaeota bacterium]|nr:monophosphatase [Candidatus Sumerlaeota bacterium]
MSLSPQAIAELRDAIAVMGADAARVLARHFRKLDSYEKKGAIDLVTVADKESEAVVLAAIHERFPDHAILAEESGSGGASGSDYLWVIDPLDGTTNFAHGMPNFGASLAVTHRGVVVAGGVFAPALGDTYLAGRGLGATRNGERLRVSSIDRFDEALIVTGFPYDRATHAAWLTDMLGRFLTRSQGLLRLGSAALDLAYVAAGNLEGFYESNLHAWDMAAGSLLVEEAGGRMSTYTGEPFSIFTDNMLASNGVLHEAMRAVLAEAPWEDEKRRAQA